MFIHIFSSSSILYFFIWLSFIHSLSFSVFYFFCFSLMHSFTFPHLIHSSILSLLFFLAFFILAFFCFSPSFIPVHHLLFLPSRVYLSVCHHWIILTGFHSKHALLHLSLFHYISLYVNQMLSEKQK